MGGNMKTEKHPHHFIESQRSLDPELLQAMNEMFKNKIRKNENKYNNHIQ